jgi:uncharacterized protein
LKRFVLITLLFCLLLGGCAKNSEDVSKKDDPAVDTVNEADLEAYSEKLALQMAGGDFDETYQRFSWTVKLQMSEKQLKEAWSTTVDGMGEFIEVYEISKEQVDRFQKVKVKLRYEYNGLLISFTYNKDSKLEGLWLNYSPIEEEEVSTDTYYEAKITFGEGDDPVTGKLTLPKNLEHPPVVILVPGSGNHDLNESVGANKPFRDIAWAFAEAGIATIRYNERAYLYPELVKENFTIETDSLLDAADAISYARNSDLIDNNSIFLLGHSLGGMMAPKIATDHQEVAGIILLAGSPRRLEEIIYDQVLDAIEYNEGVTKKQAEEAIATTKQGMNQIQKLSEESDEIILGYPASYWYSLNQINIAELSKELTLPIYIAQGSEDFQVSVEKDFSKWQEILKDKELVTFRLYDGLNHLFMKSNGKRDVTEYNVPDQVDSKVLQEIIQWINQNARQFAR